MPNGRPGDHPWTDILLHGYDPYTEDVSRMVRDIADYDEPGARHVAQWLLFPMGYNPTEEEVAELERELSNLIAEMERADDYSAKSPLEACLKDDPSCYADSIRDLVREIHGELEREVDNFDRAYEILSSMLWEAGWEPEDLEALERDLHDFREDHWIWER